MDTAPRELQTERLTLRVWHVDDAPAVREALDVSDAHLRPWIPFMKHEPRDLAGTRTWLETRRAWFADGAHFCYGVYHTADGELVGETMLLGRSGEAWPDETVLEIGYWTDVRHVGRGYATEAAQAMVQSGFADHGCDRLVMVCDPRNTASIRVPTKLGFALLRTDAGAYEDDDGIRRDSALYVRTRS